MEEQQCKVVLITTQAIHIVINTNGVEIIVLRFLNLRHITIIEVYRSTRVPLGQLHISVALIELLDQPLSHTNIFIGDFNVNWCIETERAPL